MNLITNYSKDNKMQDKALLYFIIIEVILYASFLLLDISNSAIVISNILKYISICSCFIFVLVSFLRNRSQSIVLMLIILIFTVIADTFLLFFKRFEIGIVSFIIVQILYSFKIKSINQDSYKQYRIELLGVFLVWNIIILFLISKSLFSPIVVIASLYFLIFCANMLRTWIGVIKHRKINKCKNNFSQLPQSECESWRSRRNYEIGFAIGLLLFYLCDINVGLNNLNIIDIQMPWVINILAVNASVLIWALYLPSQVILSINGVIVSKHEQ